MAPQVIITEDVARKVIRVVDAGLVSGLGHPVPGEMCVEAAVCFALGLPHGDDPECVAPSLRSLKIRLNDSAWSSNEARAKGLRKLAVLQLGTAGVLDEKEFLSRVVDMTIRKIVPRALRSVAGMKENAAHADRLGAAAKNCEAKGSRAAALDARAAANAANAAYAADAAAYAADAAAYAAANAAAYAADAAANAAYAAANAAANAAYAADAADAAKSKARDESLAFFAEEIAQILIAMKVPGVKWLDLLNEHAAA